jgi:predicted small metal-binding protein
MGKMVDCGKVNPNSGCNHVIHGANEEEVMRKAGEHAVKDHGMQVTPELAEKVRSHIEEERS